MFGIAVRILEYTADGIKVEVMHNIDGTYAKFDSGEQYYVDLDNIYSKLNTQTLITTNYVDMYNLIRKVD